MSRSNKTQQNVIEAIDAALKHPSCHDIRGVLAFVTGYLTDIEPAISKTLDKVLTEKLT